jgi:VWFA-related protein
MSLSSLPTQGRFVPGLNEEDFAVEEDRRKQEIQSFSRENSLPLSIGMLEDTSPSVSRVFDDEKETATNFLKSALRRGDLAFVIGFSREVTLVQDFTDNRQKLRDAIQSLFTQAGTSVYDAIYLACNEVFKSEGGQNHHPDF